jgi:eukaryotic-like serine/threonine-protein kinase
MRKREHTGSLPLGTILGDAYKLQRRLAEGGMGTVYEAEQLRLRRRLAVKVMSRELAGNREAFSRFHREAEILSQLAHPHIVQIVDFGAAPGGQPYLVMEFLEGEDLERRLQRTGALSLETVVHIVRQIGWALAATHGRGIVHRDLKPANVFLLNVEGEPDFVKVVDFGISKVNNTDARLTRASVLMGTPHYMAPEQASGNLAAVDHRTDQWALGCIAWEMLSGRPPFDDREITTLFYNVVHAQPGPLVGQVRGLPPDVEAVLRRALSKRPGDRFPSVAACCRALEAAARGEAVDVAAAPRLADRFVRLARTIMGTRIAEPARALAPAPRAPAPPWGMLARMTAYFRPAAAQQAPEPPQPVPRRRARWVLTLGVLAAGAAWLLGPHLPARWPLGSWSPYMSPAPQAVSVPRALTADLARSIGERPGR